MITLQEKLSRLIEATRLLAAESDEQLNALPDAVHRPDELALIFDDSFAFLDELINTGYLGQEAALLLRRIDQELEAMSGQGNAELWTENAVRESEKWAQIRSEARSVLRAVGVNSRTPDLYWVSFVSRNEESDGDS